MKKGTLPLLCAILIINLVLTGLLCVRVFAKAPGEAAPEKAAEALPEITQYVMYIGTNDKVTYKQQIPDEKVLELIDTACLKYLDGYTIMDASGRWMDEANTVTCEKTYVCYFDNTENDPDYERRVYAIADELIQQLNQNSVLLEKTTVHYQYYTGKQ